MSDQATPSVDRTAPRRLARSAFWYELSKFCLRVFCRIWLRLRVEGSERVPANGPVLLIGNHSSYLDPPLLGVGLRRPVAFLAQAGLARLAPMRWWLRVVGVTLIDRDAPSTAALRLIADALAAGEAVGLFPEGTRSADGSIAPFKNGLAFLVRRTGCAVVPIGLDGAARAFPRRALFPRPRRVVVRIGEPWSSEQVLAPGGIEALRRQLADLSRCPLRTADAAEAAGGVGAAESAAAADRASAATPRAARTSTGGSKATSGSSASGTSPGTTSTSAGGGA